MTKPGSHTGTSARFARRGEEPRSIEFGCEALLDGRAVTWRLAREFPNLAADLIEIAASVHMVDRLARRPMERELRSGSTWSRSLWLELPVREPQLWAAHWMQHVQERVLFGLMAVSPSKCVPLRYRVSMRASSVESSQRSRGLLFLAVGIATAWTLGQDRLVVFENGIGAINLPYLRSQFGSQTTRSMHPRTLSLAAQLAQTVSRQPFRIDMPALALTKAQAVQGAPSAADRATIRERHRRRQPHVPGRPA